MSSSRLLPHDLRRLFLGIARASAASSCVVACVTEHGLLGEDEPEASSDAAVTRDDAQVAHDAGSAPTDAGSMGPRDSGSMLPEDGGSALDAGSPNDASVMPDAAGESWQSIACGVGGAAPPPLLNTPNELDYLGVHSDYDMYSGSAIPTLPDGGWATLRGFAERARVGVVCSGVSSPAACEQQVSALKAGGPACATADCRFALVGTGASYARIDLRDQLLAQLGSIDTVAEAVLLAAFDGHKVCPGLGSDPRDIGMEVRVLAAAGFDLRTTWEDCGQALFQEQLRVAPDGTLTVLSKIQLAHSTCAIGRRAPGLCDAKPRGASTPAGAFLAQAARLEAASIYAFHQLVRELTALDAPRALQLAALDAMLDEVAHARDVAQLAHGFGADVAAPEVLPTPLRSRFAIALDNAQEGCVRETFGALLATYQAERAEDPEVRALMARIAEDETRHAALSWQLMAWLWPGLSAPEQSAVAAAQRRARAGLASEAVQGLSDAERRTLGMPAPALWPELLDQMDTALSELSATTFAASSPSVSAGWMERTC